MFKTIDISPLLTETVSADSNRDTVIKLIHEACISSGNISSTNISVHLLNYIMSYS